MTGMSKKFTITVAIILFVITVLILVPVFLRGRFKPAATAWLVNLERLDAAKQQWMWENNKTTSGILTWDSLRPYIGQGPEGELPRCPVGGPYILGRVGEVPRCSFYESGRSGGSGRSL